MKLFNVKSNIVLQNPRSKSLRTTIPAEVAGVLELQKGDTLIWEVTAENDEICVRLKKE